jgi:hypothetical protein
MPAIGRAIAARLPGAPTDEIALYGLHPAFLGVVEVLG